MVKEILDNGFAYESNGSVYFDVEKYNRNTVTAVFRAATSTIF